MIVDDLKVGAFFTTTRKDIWKLKSYCLYPTCTLKNLETGEITSGNFTRIKELKSLEEEIK